MDLNSTLTMNNNVEIPMLGLGMYLSYSGGMARNSIETALKHGYRHFDTAKFYANEKDVGQAVRDSDIPREELFVTTKLWNDDHGYDSTLRAIDVSLNKLGLDYMDLYLIHWPVQGQRLESWKAMEKALSDGKMRSIGVSNYMEQHLQELLDNCNVVPAINQIELSPFNYQSRKDTITICQENKVIIEAYSPLTKGERLNDQNLVKIAGRYNKSTAQMLIRWALEHQFVVIPKSSNENRIQENKDVFDFSISEEDMEYLDGLNENLATSWDPTNAI